MAKLSKDSEDHLNFMETSARRFRSGSYQMLYQLDPCVLTKAIGEALGKFQAALQEYRSSKQNDPEVCHGEVNGSG